MKLANPPSLSARARRKRYVVALIPAVMLALIIMAVAWPRHPHNNAAAASNDLKRIQGLRLIVDVHEHIASLAEVPKMLDVMDRLGIGKTCLMGSSKFTLTLNPSVGFTGYDENNEELLRICETYPGRFEAWPTIDPLDPEKLEKFKRLVERGAKGLKLYIGHGFVVKKTKQYMFHTTAIDDPGMMATYQYCQDNFIPICLHVNPSPKTPGFAEEFVAMLNAYPDLKVVCPHFMLSSILQTRLEELLDTYPNLYTDVSFGHDDFLTAGLKRISKFPTKFRNLFAKYPTRFMFSTDLVITPEAAKTVEWIQDRYDSYLSMLTQDHYRTPVIWSESLRGLGLDPKLLERVLYKNFQDFSALKPKGTKITRKIDWNRMVEEPGTAPIKRTPGETFPPT